MRCELLKELSKIYHMSIIVMKCLSMHFFVIAGEAIFESKYGKPNRSIRYSNVNCYGNEKRLADCAHHTLEFDSGSRYNTEVAGVDCHGKKKVINCLYCTIVHVVINF